MVPLQGLIQHDTLVWDLFQFHSILATQKMHLISYISQQHSKIVRDVHRKTHETSSHVGRQMGRHVDKLMDKHVDKIMDRLISTEISCRL